MFVMNFLFDFNEDNGSFADSASLTTGDELKYSSYWLKYKPTPPPAFPTPPLSLPLSFDPDAHPSDWDDAADMDTSPLILPVQSDVYVRIAHFSNPQHTFTNPELTLSICFGQPVYGKKFRASPFQDGTGANKLIRTTFIAKDLPPTRRNAYWETGAGPTSPITSPVWFYPIGTVHSSAQPVRASRHKARRFQFSLGVIIRDGTTMNDERHYSRDPEMDVTT